jgi:hypothetical protein
MFSDSRSNWKIISARYARQRSHPSIEWHSHSWLCA